MNLQKTLSLCLFISTSSISSLHAMETLPDLSAQSASPLSPGTLQNVSKNNKQNTYRKDKKQNCWGSDTLSILTDQSNQKVASTTSKPILITKETMVKLDLVSSNIAVLKVTEDVPKNTVSEFSLSLTSILKLPSVGEAKSILVRQAESTANTAESATIATDPSAHVADQKILREATLVNDIYLILDKSNYTEKFNGFINGESHFKATTTNIKLRPYSSSKNISLNISYSILMDNFLKITGDDESAAEDKLHRLNALTTEFKKLIAEQENLIANHEDLKAKSDVESVKSNCDNCIRTAQEEINNLRKYFKQMLFHTGIAYDYITTARKAIADNESLLKTSAEENTSFQTVKKTLHQTSENALCSITYLKQNIVVMEALLHALYPFVREHAYGMMGQFANTVYNWNWKSEAHLLREKITDQGILPSTLELPIMQDESELSRYAYADLIKNFNKAIRQMLMESSAMTTSLTNQQIQIIDTQPVINSEATTKVVE